MTFSILQGVQKMDAKKILDFERSPPLTNINTDISGIFLT